MSDIAVYLLQVAGPLAMPSEECATAYEQICRTRFWRPNVSVHVATAVLGDVQALEDAQNCGRNVIPVGSVEFVEWCIRHICGLAEYRLKPLHVPQALWQSYAGRKTATVSTHDELLRTFGDWDAQRLFVKSGSVLKGDYAGIYTTAEVLSRAFPLDTAYFVSEPLSIASEWRVFVSRGRAQDARPYSGDPFCVPDRQTIHNIIADFQEAPQAYTLDLAVTTEGNTVLVEVHNFVACGLYGFAGSGLLRMLADGFRRELRMAVAFARHNASFGRPAE